MTSVNNIEEQPNIGSDSESENELSEMWEESIEKYYWDFNQYTWEDINDIQLDLDEALHRHEITMEYHRHKSYDLEDRIDKLKESIFDPPLVMTDDPIDPHPELEWDNDLRWNDEGNWSNSEVENLNTYDDLHVV
ncbi:TPA_asm: P8 [Ilex alphacytorhabdovirus 1]|nr:TPA_asm: P8 [Ilex alphacytorhabdovirus 1]